MLDKKITTPSAEATPLVPASVPASSPATGSVSPPVLKTTTDYNNKEGKLEDRDNKTSPPLSPAPPDNLPIQLEGKELPPPISDLVPEEIVEPVSELPEPDKEKEKVIVADEDEKKVPLPEVYTIGVETPARVSDKVLDDKIKYPYLKPELGKHAEEILAPKAPAPSRAESEPAEDFNIRFRKKLRELLDRANIIREKKVENNLKKIIDFALERNAITNNDVEDITGVKNTQAYEYLKILVKKGKLVKFGFNKNTFYKPVKH